MGLTAREAAWKALRRPLTAFLALGLGSLAFGAATGPLAPNPNTWDLQPSPPSSSRPAPGVTDAQLQHAVQRATTAATIRQRIQQSGLAPAEVQARLQAAGYCGACGGGKN